MDDTNKTTLESYDAGVNAYIENTDHKRDPAVQDWLDKSTAGLEPDARILEIGSGYGRDAMYLESKGFHVEKTDAAKGFVDVLQRTDPTAHILNILTDEISGTYDLIIANGVLLHFTAEELELALAKIFNALKHSGTFAFTVKQGIGEEWQNNKNMGPRFFKYWNASELTEILTKNGFVDINSWINDIDAPNATWILFIVKRNP